MKNMEHIRGEDKEFWRKMSKNVKFSWDKQGRGFQNGPVCGKMQEKQPGPRPARR